MTGELISMHAISPCPHGSFVCSIMEMPAPFYISGVYVFMRSVHCIFVILFVGAIIYAVNILFYSNDVPLGYFML